MSSYFKDRQNHIALVVFALMALLLLRLFMITVIQSDVWTKRAESLTTKTLYTAAPRGRILDRYGRVLADNSSSFSVTFNGSALSDEELSSQVSELYDIITMSGDVLLSTLPIVEDASGQFSYTYDDEIEAWLSDSNMPLSYTAQMAFDSLRATYGIDPEADVYEAQLELQNVYGVYPPISVRTMEYTENVDKAAFLARYKLEDGMTAKAAYKALLEYFDIPSSFSREKARGVLSVRNALLASGYYSYIPVTVAKNVSDKTVVLIKERSLELTGAQIIEEAVRVYPYGNSASHVLGYMGSITEAEKDSYLNDGYNATDLVGKAGIESAYEHKLHGENGVEVVQINAQGERIGVISKTETKKGQDVCLTIDLELQKLAESSLDKLLEALQTGGTYKSPWGNVNYDEYPNANVGAVVAIEVETGDVLAMASNPDYDPNLFKGGISSADWASLQAENPRDPLSPTPLFNVAARTAVQPGSAFKPVVATAALANGLNPNKEYRDGGFVTVGDREFNCLVWKSGHNTHGLIDMYEAMEVSCNYYFYNLICNYDHYREVSMGMDDDMGVTEVTDYALQYGLGEATGIEITETIGSIPSKELKMSTTKVALRRMLNSRTGLYFKDEVLADSAALQENINKIVDWCEENPARNDLMERLVDLGVKKDKLDELTDLCKFSYYTQAQWTKGDLLNISIGQGDNAYTPLQMANYMATIGNGGKRNKVSLVKSVEGEGKTVKAPLETVEADDEAFEDILKAMTRVTQGKNGSATAYFNDFPIDVAAKSGSAEKSGKINPKDEVAYVRAHLKSIAPGLSWTAVKTKMDELMASDPATYSDENIAVDSAIVRLTDYRVSTADIDAYKDDYANFAWFICCAPADDPKIAVAVLLFQGGVGSYGAPVARDIIGGYFQQAGQYDTVDMTSGVVE